jgi:tetratricopeptide (TPR) repeat protein
MYLSGSHPDLRRRARRSNPRRIFFFITLIAAGLFLFVLQRQGTVKPLFIPTPTATRNPISFADEGAAQFAAGNLKQAIVAYTKAAETDPKNVDYKVALARTQIYSGQYADALVNAQNALLVAPNSAKSNAIYAWALDWIGDLDAAQAAATKAIALDSNYAPANAYYAEILLDQGQWDQGSNYAEMALRLDPNLLEARRAMGYAYEVQGDYEQAIQYYKSALEINPNLATLYIKLGVMYRSGLQDPEQAIIYFSKANALDIENVEPYLYLSRTYYQIDKIGTAIQYLQEALTHDPTNPRVHGELGVLLFKRKNYEGALPELKLAVFGGSLTDEEGQEVKDKNGNPVTVQGLELSNLSLAYYYTLGNLRAFNATSASPESCGSNPDDAPTLLRLALNFAPDDPTVQGSYADSMAICDRVNQGLPPISETPTEPASTPEP